jgi:hypothetical protein
MRAARTSFIARGHKLLWLATQNIFMATKENISIAIKINRIGLSLLL